MSLDAFLGSAAVAAQPTPAPADAAKEPWGVVDIQLPSGLQVYYQAGPVRLYRLRQLLQTKIEFADWREVPSMSTVAKILDKPGLVHWAEQIGINLVQELLRKNWVDVDFVKEFRPGEEPDPRKPWWGGDHLQQIGKTKKLTNYYIKEEGGDKGNAAHNALEAWAMSGDMPDPYDYPEHQQGYVIGLVKFLTESGFQALKSEVIVGSIEHEVAGRFDTSGVFPKDVELCVHLTKPKENKKLKLIPAGSAIVDLKTSKGIYPDHHLQTAGYKGCMVESGYDEPEYAYILRTTRAGNYELVPCTAEWMDFWWLRGLYGALQTMEARRKAA